MKAQIFVNRHKVRENKKHGINQPCIGIRTYKGSQYAKRIKLHNDWELTKRRQPLNTKSPKRGFKPDLPEMVPMPKSPTHEVWVSFEGTAKVYVTAETNEAAIEEACDNVLARGKVKKLEITYSEAHRLREA